MANAAAELATLVNALNKRVDDLETRGQLSRSTVEIDDETVEVPDVADRAVLAAAAVPPLEDRTNAVAEALDVNTAAVDEALAAAEANREDAEAELALAREEIEAAFSTEIENLSDRVDKIVVGAGGTLILFSEEEPSGTAPTGSTWFLINESENVAGQWQQTGTEEAPVWTPREIESSVVANLDVAKLTAGQAALAEVVAQKIAASTASIQTVNVGNLFVTEGATMPSAVIEYLFAKVVQAKKITADMLDVNTFRGKTITGAIIKSAPSGQRVEIEDTVLRFYDGNGVYSGYLSGESSQFGPKAESVVWVGTPSSSSAFGLQTLYGGKTKVGANIPSLASDAHVVNGVIYGTGQTGLYRLAKDGARKPLLTVTAERPQLFDQYDWDRLADTGWQNARAGAYALDPSKPFRYRVRGDQVYLYGQLNASGGVNGSQTGVATIPSQYAPKDEQVVQVTGAAGVLMRVRLRTDGRIDMAGSSGASTYVIFDGLNYFIS